MLICMMVGAMFFRWLQDEEFWCNNRFVYRTFHWIGGSAYNNN